MGTPVRAAAYSQALRSMKAVIHICSAEVGPLELGSVVALCLVTSTLIPCPFSGRKEELESGVIFPFFFFSLFFPFFAKGLLPVSELWLLAPELFTVTVH